jgi:hypothetical protein
MTKGGEPRFHDKWRADLADREEDAASLFGYYLIKHCREKAISDIPLPPGSDEHKAAVAAVETALFNVMDLLGGYFGPLDAGNGKRLQPFLQIQIEEAGEVVEDLRVSPTVDYAMGYWAWVDDYGITPKAVA